MISEEIVVLAALVLILLAMAALAMMSVMQGHKRLKKFESRLNEVVTPGARPANVTEEELSLTRTVTRLEQLREKAANFIGVDLRQSETYPIKWWLVPPLALALTLTIDWLAAHPLGGYRVLLYALFYGGTPAIWLMLTKFAFNWFMNRRNAKLLEQFPDALNTIVRCVRVGIPMGEALRTVARDAPQPTKTEFDILADKVSIGIPLDVALRELSLRIKLTEYQFFATALSLQARSGGGITQTLETLADVIRKRVGLKARGYALTAEARTSAMILAVLPFVAGGGIFVMQRQYIVTAVRALLRRGDSRCRHPLDGHRHGRHPVHDQQCFEIVPMPILYIFIAIVVLFVVVAASGFFVFGEYARAGRLASRIEFVIEGGEKRPETKPETAALLRFVSAFGMLIARSGVLSRKTLAEMTATLEGAGFRGGRGLGLFIGAKILLAVLVPLMLLVMLHDFGTGTFLDFGESRRGRRGRPAAAGDARQQHPPASSHPGGGRRSGCAGHAGDLRRCRAGAGSGAGARGAGDWQSQSRFGDGTHPNLTRIADRLGYASGHGGAGPAHRAHHAEAAGDHALAIAAIRHAAHPGAAHALRRIAPGSPDHVRGARRPAADHDDHPDDSVYPALRVSGRRRTGHH